jgi:L-lactate dehydrogenase complex protein LldE
MYKPHRPARNLPRLCYDFGLLKITEILLVRVGFFVTCLVDLVRPRIGFAAIKLLENAGCEVVFPATQTCCGQPGYNSGDVKSGRELALKFLEEFQGCDYIVAPSGSCSGMIRVHYPIIFKDEPQLLRQLTALTDKTYELTDFLVNIAKVKALPKSFVGPVTYHDSCSGLRELGIKQQPRALLKSCAIEVKEMIDAEVCCGFGGTFSVKLGDISTRMAENKCANIHATGANALVGGDLGCLLSIEGRLRRNGDHTTKVLHIAEVLADLPHD